MKRGIPALCALAFAACATSYTKPRLDSFEFDRNKDTSGVEVQYSYNVLNQSGNQRYDEKARLQGVDLVAIRLTNRTDREINVQRDVDFYVGGTQATPQAPAAALAGVRQTTGAYSWWFLLALVNGFKTEISCNSESCHEDTQFIPIGIILGPLIAGINMAVSSSANESLIKDATENDLSRKTLKPGEAATGYLVFEGIGKSAITARLKP